MKIAILGHAGSGKSTLARQLGEKYGLPVLHFDSIHFLPGWVETDRPYKREKVNAFLDENPDGWVMDGNYFKICAERRFAEADRIRDELKAQGVEIIDIPHGAKYKKN